MVCSLVEESESAATALEMLLYFCPEPTVKAPEGAVVRLPARARVARFRRRGRKRMFRDVILLWGRCVGRKLKVMIATYRNIYTSTRFTTASDEWDELIRRILKSEE